ncbi:MAG TPA: phospholipase D-like domain-containing protein [Bryobacteraceae bacterium]|nr:phospholipase D-like domain-containing protein [Bryobacteraceae bacterium]
MFLNVLAALADASIHRRTRIEVLRNGDVFYDAVAECMATAKKSINMEAYVFEKGEVTSKLLRVMTERAKMGVKVNLVIDAIGSFATWSSYFRELTDAGGQVYFYHGFRWHQIPRINSRTHREIVVVDCQTGFVGGPGFADQWLKPMKKKPQWRDTMFRLEGDAVAALQSTFIENFLEASGELLCGDEYFCFDGVDADAAVLVVDSSVSSGQSTRARMLFQTLMSAAHECIEITTPYFLPDRGVRKELVRAIRERHVQVNIICPGEHNDHLITRHTSRRLYGQLLRAGARIFEYQPSMIHVKSLIVDRKWAVFGSTNFDHRSFSINDELNVATTDPRVIGTLREHFAMDMSKSTEVTWSKWRKRSLFERVYAAGGSLLERQQ